MKVSSRSLSLVIIVVVAITVLAFIAVQRIAEVEEVPPRPSEWDYVALGDSTVAWAHSYAFYYAAHIEADLGVNVTLHNWGRDDQTSAKLLDALRSNQELRDAISEAEVLTFVIGANDIPMSPGVDPSIVEEALTSFRANFDAIIAEILSLRSTDDTIIRTMTYFNPFVSFFKEHGVFEEFRPYGEAFTEHIVEAASENNIAVARVHLDMNGPTGEEDPAEKDYIAFDGVHLSDAGHRRVAQLHGELGYEPLGS